MLSIKGLYKEVPGNLVNDISISVSPGELVCLECSHDLSDLLMELILGKQLPGKGEILMDGVKSTEYLKTSLKHVGVILREEGYYDRLSLETYLKLFSGINNYKGCNRELMMNLGLLDIGKKRVASLSHRQKRRLSMAREMMKALNLLIIQEPITNTDKDSSKIIMENIQQLLDQGVAVLCTTQSYKDMLLLGGRSYTLDSTGLVEVNKESNNPSTQGIEQYQPVYEVLKVPAKAEDKLLLFDPFEIDYIESEHGLSSLSVRGDKYPCTISLSALEERLKHLGFFRCHRSYLVNLQRVREVVIWTRNSFSLSLEDKNKSSIPLSKGRLDELKNILNL